MEAGMLPQPQTTASKAFLDPSCLHPEIRRCSCVYRDISRRLTGRAHIFSADSRKCETAGSPESKSRGNSLLAQAGVSTRRQHGREDRSQPARILPRRRAQPSSRRNYYLGRSRRIAQRKPLEVGNVPLTRERHSRPFLSPDKAKSPARKPGIFIAKGGGTINLFRGAESMSFLGEFRRWEKCCGLAK